MQTRTPVRPSPDSAQSGRDEQKRLLKEIAGGSKEALGTLYEILRVPVYGMALSILGDAQEAQDVTQDTFLRVWEAAGGYRPEGSPTAWVLTIARNFALMQLRRSAPQELLEEGKWDAIPSPAPAVTPEDRQILQTALAALDGRERQIVLLHASSGLKHREIADLLQLPLSTVLSCYHRALKKMKRQLKGGTSK